MALTRGQVEVFQQFVPFLAVRGNSAVVGHVALLCADGAVVHRDVSEVDPVGPVGRFASPGGARRVGVSSSSSSAAAASTSSSAPSTVAEGVHVGGAVAGCRRWLGGVLRGLSGGILEAVNNLANFLKRLAFGQLFDFLPHLFLQSADDQVDAFPLRHCVGDPLDLLFAGRAIVAGVAGVASGQRSGDGLFRLLADFVLVETTAVDEVAAELAFPDVQGFGLRPPGVGCELDAEAVGELLLEGVPVGEIAHELGLRPVPLLGHSGETLVEILEPPVTCDTSMLAVSEETVNKFLCEGTYLEDIVALSGESGYDGLRTAGSPACGGGGSRVCHVGV